MAVPFRKVSKTRRDMRRTHYKVEANGLVKCPNCNAMILPHRLCPECGFYKGKNVLVKEVQEVKAVKEAEPKKEKVKKEKVAK